MSHSPGHLRFLATFWTGSATGMLFCGDGTPFALWGLACTPLRHSKQAILFLKTGLL